MYADDVMGGGRAEIAYDKKSQKKFFDGEVEYERFYQYLRYASMNTFEHLAAVYWDKLEQLLREDGEPRAAEWFKNSLTAKDGCWMMAHSGQGLSNTNCSMEVHWRVLKAATLGSAGSSGGGYSQLRVQSNLTGFIEDESRKSIAEMVEKGQLVIPIFLPQFFCPKIGPKFISEGSSDPSDDRYVPIYIYTYIYYMYVHILCS